MTTKHTYTIAPVRAVDPDSLLSYLVILSVNNVLKYRFCDSHSITPLEAADHLIQNKHSYLVLDEHGLITAEFTMCEFSGKSAKLHFSQLPYNSPGLNRFLAKVVTDNILNMWVRDPKGKYDSFVDTLVGVTAVKNKVACIYVLRSGFKKLGVIPNCITYMGHAEDAMISVKTRKI